MLVSFIKKNYLLFCHVSTQDDEALHNGHDKSSHASLGIKLLLTSNERLLEESTATVSKKNKTKPPSSSERCVPGIKL